MLCNSLFSFGLEKSAYDPTNMARKSQAKPGVHAFLFIQCQTEEFCFYLRKKELISITKEAWHLTLQVWGVSARKGEVNRW